MIAASPVSRLPLDDFPFLRSSDAQEVSARMGQVFSPHRLEVRTPRRGLQVQHNQLPLRELSINTLSYGTEVLIDPGERGDFYMVQLPLSGRADLHSDRQQVSLDTATLSVLQPHARSLMRWSDDCAMILLRVPRLAVERRTGQAGGAVTPRFALARRRQDPEVAAWWQAALDLTLNLDRHGDAWLRYPAAQAAIEEFLLSAFTTLLRLPDAPASDTAGERADQRCLRRAKDYIHAHLDQALGLDAIARQACVSPRTLEAVFQRHCGLSPLTYARQQRLQAVHQALSAAAGLDGASVTDIALAHGFVHMGRFASQYRQAYGVSPSQTLRAH